ncbi:hypothetical protein SARC_09116 [Sphaeroforma arctica JP610]|uniref:1-alkyl-2-acetylglycerophosphocholine esterase n=1 Tax=Sphaeroforma arctica JP610 TaxID=667725 RepID=A0A0L0FR21_9EUKA|nr:hypothetical protein SARC_09116 [Sphaeroforma arctica JP610]KNC78453.1 hypothetical protein SARC_09116 [Sphaeroforma arctica JP610]|eukprot:XP_014152355.1 hypothetical protein SARC_09116 [Sphaeroforma arctica JP610]
MGDSNIIKAAQYAMSGLDKLSLAPALPNPTGSFSVSHSDIEALTPNGTRSFVRLYYPSTEEGSPSKWLPDYEYGAGYGDFLSIPKWIVGGVASSVVGHINIPGGKDSPLEPPPAPATKWPVFVFSHGLATWRSHYSATCNELASRGVVVVSIEHRDGSAIASVAADGDAEANVKYESLDELIEKLLFVGASGGRLSSTDYWAQNLSKIRNIARMSGGVKEGDSKNAIDRLQDARVVWLGMKGATHVDFSDIVFFAPNWVYATYDYLLIGPDGLSPAIILNRTMTVAYAFITADIDAKSSVFVDPEYR